MTTHSLFRKLGALPCALLLASSAIIGCIPTNPPEAEPPEIEEVSGGELPEYRNGRPSEIEQEENEALTFRQERQPPDDGVANAPADDEDFDDAALFLEG